MASRKTTTRPAPDLTSAGTTGVALYLRISTDEDHQPFSLGSRSAPRKPASPPSSPATGLGTGQTYTDQFSGAYAERSALQQALRDARLGLYDTLCSSTRSIASPGRSRCSSGSWKNSTRSASFPLSHRTDRHLYGDRTNAHPAPRSLRRVRTGHDHRPCRRRHGAKGGPRRRGYGIRSRDATVSP